ncbi:MAG TPA: hypothetical protein VF609_16020, partial [Flavisolibacter sp.]
MTANIRGFSNRVNIFFLLYIRHLKILTRFISHSVHTVLFNSPNRLMDLRYVKGHYTTNANNKG